MNIKERISKNEYQRMNIKAVNNQLAFMKFIGSICCPCNWLFLARLILMVWDVFKILFLFWGLLCFWIFFRFVELGLLDWWIADLNCLWFQFTGLGLLGLNWRMVCFDFWFYFLFIFVLLSFHLEFMMFLNTFITIICTLILISTTVAFILDDMGKNFAPNLSVVILINDLFAQNNFVNVLLTQDSEFSLDDIFIILQFCNDIKGRDFVLLIRKFYVVIFLSCLQVLCQYLRHMIFSS